MHTRVYGVTVNIVGLWFIILCCYYVTACNLRKYACAVFTSS